MSSSNQSTTSSDTRHALSGIMYPGRNVMLGRGGEANYHSGNIYFRELAESYRKKYKEASKSKKPKIAAEVVSVWRSLDPPGRFLVRTDPNCPDSLWHDVGERMAIKRATKTLGERTQRERRAEQQQQAAKERQLASVFASNDDHGAQGNIQSIATTYLEKAHSDASSSASDQSDKKMSPSEKDTFQLSEQVQLSQEPSRVHAPQAVGSDGSSGSSPPSATSGSIGSWDAKKGETQSVLHDYAVGALPTAAFLAQRAFQESGDSSTSPNPESEDSMPM